MIHTAEALRKQEDRRRERRLHVEASARRKLMPVMVVACELLGVTVEDILADNRHRDVVVARDVVYYLGYHHCKIGTTTLCVIMNRDRTTAAHTVRRVKKKLSDPRQFKLRGALLAVEKKLQEKKS